MAISRYKDLRTIFNRDNDYRLIYITEIQNIGGLLLGLIKSQLNNILKWVT